jgi:low density lipoprotein-related protein 2
MIFFKKNVPICSDFTNDCGDNSDELPSSCPNGYRECSESEFRCGNGRCIPRRFLCDMDQDCLDADNSDEKDCANHTCPAGQFQCKSGHCVAMHFRVYNIIIIRDLFECQC